MDHFIARAQQHRKRGEYTEAIKQYTRAIASAPSVTFYDERADCYMRQGDLASALKDAKTSIQHASADPTGYLRAARVLTQMGQKSAALTVMRAGLRKVRHAGQAYDALQSLHTRLETELCPNARTDPFTLLPRELGQLILDHLSFRQRVSSMRVSKAWRQYIASCEQAWDHVDFSSARRRVRTSAVQTYIKHTGKRPITVTLDYMMDFENALNVILRQPSVQSLCLGTRIPRLGAGFMASVARKTTITTLSLPEEADMPSEVVAKFVLARATTLQGLSIFLSDFNMYPFCRDVDLPMLQHLSISGDVRRWKEADRRAYRDTYLDPRRMSALRTLKISGQPKSEKPLAEPHRTWLEANALETRWLAALKTLRHLELDVQAFAPRTWHLPSTIQKLHLTLDYVDNITHLDFCLWLPQLLDLRIKMPQHGLTEWMLCPILQRPASQEHQEETYLRSLHLECSWGQKPSALMTNPAYTRLKHLQHLALIGAMDLDDEDMDAISSHFADLQSLEIAWEPKLTGSGVRAFLENKPERSLVLSNCDRVSADTFDWARQHKLKLKTVKQL